MIEKQRDFLLECILFHKSTKLGERPRTNRIHVYDQYFAIIAYQNMLSISNDDIGWLKIYPHDDIVMIDNYKVGRKQINDVIQYLNSMLELDSTQIQLSYGRDPFGLNFLDEYIDSLLEFMKK